MSKVDAQRAMRDARYAAYQARKDSGGGSATAAPAAAPRKAAAKTPAKADADPVAATPPAQPDGAEPAEVVVTAEVEGTAEVTEALCGHRSIGNKSCTRPAGHAEKSHRYS